MTKEDGFSTNEASERQITEEHVHCDNCFNIAKCIKKQKSKDSNYGLGKKCPIVACALNCGARFHRCKLDEHILLCPLKIISCINSHYGCPFRMERRYVSQHLECCPARYVMLEFQLNSEYFN